MRLKPELKGALLALLGVALVLVGIWVVAGIRLGVWSYAEHRRYSWLTANLPVAHRLWNGGIRAGDDVEELITTWRPHMTSRFGRWIELRWFPGGPSQDLISFIGVRVVARDGVLVSADYYSDDGVADRAFFNTLTPGAETEYSAAFTAYVNGLQAAREQKAQPHAPANRSQPTLPATDQTSPSASAR